jgi:chorismate-pyruvate lyase
MVKLTPDIVYTHGSMTQHLRKLSGGEVQIKVLHEGFCKIDGQQQWVRDVELYNGTQKLMGARTRVSAESIAGPLKILTELGLTPLGDWLFKQNYEIVSREHHNETERTTVYHVNGAKLTLEEKFDL